MFEIPAHLVEAAGFCKTKQARSPHPMQNVRRFRRMDPVVGSFLGTCFSSTPFGDPCTAVRDGSSCMVWQ